MEAGAVAEPQDGKAAVAPTEYVVLKQTDDQAAEYWQVVEGTTVQEAAEKGGEGTYVQVPKRSWRPRTAKLEQVTRVRVD